MPENIKRLDTALNPTKEKERDIQTKQNIQDYEDTFGDVDFEQSFPHLFELLWYSQLPCIDVKGFTSEVKDEMSLIKRCFWKNKPISCNSIFVKRPTDRGMCCAFNMEKAENFLKENKYASSLAVRQSIDSKNSFDTEKLPSWYIENKEPTPEPGIERGLTLIVDRHSDKLSPASVFDDFKGFPVLVDGKTKFPLMKMSGDKARPGFETNFKVRAFQLHAEQEIRQYTPQQRNCLFPDEMEMKYHREYSQENCLFECKLDFSAKCLTTCNKFGQTCDCEKIVNDSNIMELTQKNDTCVPWFFPLEVGNAEKICNPWNTMKFRQILMDQVPVGICKHCLPDCTTTKYETSLSYAELVECDGTTVGSSGKLCDLIRNQVNPTPWITVAQNEFEYSNMSIPWYLITGSMKGQNETTKFSDKRSRHDKLNADARLELFKAQLENTPPYDAFRKDIGIINVYFEDKKISHYTKANKMTMLDFMYQIGGSLGLMMGISIVSLVEVIYWIIFRFICTIKK